jgi:hypothetical protein
MSCNGKICDALAGPAGMKPAEYLAKLRSFGVTPKIQGLPK